MITELTLSRPSVTREERITNILREVKQALDTGVLTQEDFARELARLALSEEGLKTTQEGVAIAEICRRIAIELAQEYPEVLNVYTEEVKRIVDLLGGTITVKSEEGKGTTFTIHLPVVAEDEEEVLDNPCQSDGLPKAEKMREVEADKNEEALQTAA